MTDTSASLGLAGPTGGIDPIVDPAVSTNADDYKERFEQAEPFKHVVIEPFFAKAIADQLAADFPLFDPARAMNEFGAIGLKAANEQLAIRL